MRLGRQVRTLFGILLAIQVITSLAGIALLDRMSPAIGQVRDENVASVWEVENMLGALTSEEPGPTARERFTDALSAAEENITEPEERRLLAVARRRADAAFAGDLSARREVVDALGELGVVNLRAMDRADQAARRLGSAGRWALAFLALAGLAASILAMRRARRSLLLPLAELSAVVKAYRKGDFHRRCAPARQSELADVLAMFNELLDRAERGGAVIRGDRELEDQRRLVLDLLDRLGEPLLVVDPEGAVLATSTSALEPMAERGGEILGRLREGEPDAAVLEVRPVEGTKLRIVRLEEPEAA